MYLEEGGDLRAHVLKMSNFLTKIECIDQGFDQNLASMLFLKSLHPSFVKDVWDIITAHSEWSWVDIINLIRRNDELLKEKAKFKLFMEKEDKKERNSNSLGEASKVFPRCEEGWKKLRVIVSTHECNGEEYEDIAIESTDSSPGTLINLNLHILFHIAKSDGF